MVVSAVLAVSCDHKSEADSPAQAGEPASTAEEKVASTITQAPVSTLRNRRGRNRAQLPPELRRGNWHKVRSQALSRELTAEQQEEIDDLMAIAYLSGTRTAPETVDVTIYNEEKAYNGVNFYTSGHGCEALLVDMYGKVLHRWSYDYDKLWPQLKVSRNAAGKWKWRRAHLFPNGDILAIHEGIGMIKLDKDSNLLWEYSGRAHHDMQVMEDGSIYVLTRRAMVVPRINEEFPVMDDFITHLSPDGKELKQVSVLESLENANEEDLLSRMPKRRELFHTNSIEILDGRLAETIPAFKKGNVFISILKLDTIAVIDLEEEKVVWTMEGDFKKQHHPTILENGNLLLFDNLGGGTKSNVYEFDPISRRTVWLYQGTDDHPFYSRTCGSCYRLPNGNTLICESDGGRAFEITQDKAIVWEYFNPNRGGENDEYIAILYDIQRFGPDFPLDWLAEEVRAEKIVRVSQH